MTFLFHDRREAGLRLANRLEAYRDAKDVVILALPRGGVPVAAPIAHHLHLPLDVLIVRKLGTPRHEELAMGAVAQGGVRLLNDDVVRRLRISPDVIDRIAAVEQREVERREQIYRGHRKTLPIRGNIVILVDDGLATGMTMRAAVAAVRQLGASRVIAAIPVASWEACKSLACVVDELVCLHTPEPFYAVGSFYEEFPQLTDQEVHRLLHPPLGMRQRELV